MGHQGPYRTAMTIRQRFFIHNLINKVKRYIEACHTCLKTKLKYKKNRPVYGRVPIDYAPMQDLSIDIKQMPIAFGRYQYLLVITCDQTNFTVVTPLRSRDAYSVAEVLIYRVIYLLINGTLPTLLPNKVFQTSKGPATATGIKGQLHFGSRQKRAIPVMAILQAGAAIGGTLMKGINALVDVKRAKSFNNALKMVAANIELTHQRLMTLENRCL